MLKKGHFKNFAPQGMLRETRPFEFFENFEPPEAQRGPKMGFERIYWLDVLPQDSTGWLDCLSEAIFGLFSCKITHLLVKIRQFSTSIAPSTQKFLQNIHFCLHLMLPLNWKHNLRKSGHFVGLNAVWKF